VEPFSPPEGSVPIGGGEAPVSNVVDAESDVLQNPVAADLRSLENGRLLYETNCAVCHGKTGLADGPVAPVFAGVLPLVGVVKARSDGHIYTTIRYGRRRMPGYGRIPADDRWDVVNYVRYLDQKGGQP
jgi:mono/diheme cytochrome c family protein